jgi:hypothetical protein
MSVRSAPTSDGANDNVTITVPPPAGTDTDPEPLTVPSVTVACRTAPPHPAGSPLMVTLMMVLAETLLSTVSPAVVQRGTVSAAAPKGREMAERAAADPTETAANERAPATIRRRHMRRPMLPPIPDYPLMTTLIPVTNEALTAGEKVAEKLVPVDGVVPVASPRDAPPAPDRVILYASA